MTANTSSPRQDDRPRDDLPDGRNGRIVGENDDNVLESIGKSVIAPVEGADEGAEPVDAQHGRAFVDLTKTLPQGQSAAPRTPTAPKPDGKAL
ncbi:MAG: hypothetical protein JF586_23190 [Burkholderiales bacterium]|nr:hypothetical protein [Burkholderiales bacterium]